MVSIQEMLKDLESAVVAGDQARAFAIAKQLQQCLYAEAGDVSDIERKIEALLDALPLSPMQAPLAGEEFGVGPSSPSPVAEGVEHDREASPDFSREPKAAEVQRKSKHDESLFKSAHINQKTAPESDAGVVYPVWFGTNRKPDGLGGFSGERSTHITRGKAEVFVPEAHRFGEMGTGFWSKLRRLDFRDDNLTLQSITEQESDTFYSELREMMQDARDDGRSPHALFFLHGYNVSFEEAAIRAAQIGFDLKVPGATAFFSWPSRGDAKYYPMDEAAIEASEEAITSFLLDFTKQCGAEKVHIIAHSMGNRGLLRALQRIASNAEARGQVRFGQIFLAAPDVDRDLFLDLARNYPKYAERTTLYASRRDLAIRASNLLHGGPRAGYYAPYTVLEGLDTIVVPNFNVDLLGHSYFADAEALLHDIFSLMRHDAPPVDRQRLAPVEHEAGVWRFLR